MTSTDGRTVASEALRQAGLEALARGDFAAAAGSLMQAVQAEPGNAQNWLALMLALARGGDVAMLAQVVGLWGNVRGDRFSCLFDAFTLLMTYSLHDQVLALASATPTDGPDSLPGLYYSGCVHILRDEEDAAFARFNRFKELAAAHHDILPIGPEHPFNVAYRQGSLVEDRAYVERLMAAPAPAAPPVIPVAPIRHSAAPYVLVAACNGRYFDIFAETYLHAVERVMAGTLLHVHVVDPPFDLAERVRHLSGQLPRTTLNVSQEPLPPQASAAYFASSRFLIAGQLLDLYGRDLLVTDIDMDFIADPAPWLPRLAEQAFACYAYRGFGPASRMVAGITHFSHLHGGRAVADAISRFIHSKLDVPWPHNWMLDQAALLSAVRWIRQARPDLSIGRFNTLFDGGIETLLRQQERDDEKQKAMDAAR